MNRLRPPVREVWISVKKKGRLIIGTVFFLCLIISYGIYRGYWDETEKIVSASDTFGPSSQIKDRKNFSNYSLHENGKDVTKNTKGDGKATLIFSTRGITRGEPLMDPFLTNGVAVGSNLVAVGVNPSIVHKNQMEQKPINSKPLIDSFGVISPNYTVRSKKIELVGIINGQWPVAILRVEGKEITMGVGIQEGFSVLKITQRGVLIEEGGMERWLGN